MDKVLALHAGSRGFDSHQGHMSQRFFRSNRPRYPHPVSSELENSGIKVVIGDCSVTERRRWRPPYQTGKTVHVHAKHYKHNEDGRTHGTGCVRQWFRTAEAHGERRYENWNTHTHDFGSVTSGPTPPAPLLIDSSPPSLPPPPPPLPPSLPHPDMMTHPCLLKMTKLLFP